MLRLRLSQITYLLVAGCFFSILARAQGVRIFAEVSGSNLYDEKFFTIGGNPFSSNYASGGKVTFGAEYTPWRVLGFEGSYGIGRNNLRVATLQGASAGEAGYGVRTQRFSGNVMLHSPFALVGWRPYLTGGLEYDRLGPSSSAKRLAFAQGFAGQPNAVLGASNLVGVNFGGGVEWGFLPAFGLRFDLRNHITGTPTYGLPQQATTGAIFPVSGAANNLEFSAGITFHLGR